MQEVIRELWGIVGPLAALFVGTIGPIVIGYLATRLTSLLGITEEKKKAELEAQLREALHASALNALTLAATKFKLAPLGVLSETQAISDAVYYIKERNPDAVKRFKLDDAAIEDILTAKVPFVEEILKKSAM